MPPRYTYWTILLEGGPTAFRAVRREELLPTLKQLQARHPDAVMKWFARGRLWESQEEARAAAARSARRPADTRERRGRDWRPGGEHRDPRDRRAAKTARDRRPSSKNRPRPGGGAARSESTPRRPRPHARQPGRRRR